MTCCSEVNCFGRPRGSSLASLLGLEIGGKIITDDPQVALRAISERPSVIDYDLETTVWRWETAINEYREYEADVFSSKSDTAYEILGLLEALRAKPAAFLNSDIEEVKNLALKRSNIYKWQHRLGLASSDAPDQNTDEIPSPNRNTGSSPLHDSGIRRLETSFSGSQSGTTSFSASALHLNDVTDVSKEITIPPDPLLYNSLKTLQNLSENDDFIENRNVAVVKLVDKKESIDSSKPLTTPLRPYRAESNLSSRFSVSSKKGDRPSLRESLRTPRRSTLVSMQPRSSLKVALKASTHDDRTADSMMKPTPEADQSAGDVDVSVTRVLSLTWAGRLNEVNSTQGTFHIQSSTKSDKKLGSLGEPSEDATADEGSEDGYHDRLSHSIVTVTSTSDADGIAASHHIHRIKPKWPAFLQEVWYDVVKWNNYGAKQRRIIKLTEYCIMNIKDGNKITKMYHYMNITRIWIESSAMFKIVLKDGTKLCYISEMAPTIVQQITTRVQVRIALEKTTFSSMPVSPDSREITGPGYSQETAHKLIEAINQDHEQEASGVMQDFAMSLMNNIPVYGNRDKSKASVDLNGVSIEERKARAARMINKSENSPEYIVQSKIEKIIFDDITDEGNTRKVFLDSFNEGNTLVSVRHFIDGLHEYLLTARGVQLALLYSSKENLPVNSLENSNGTINTTKIGGNHPKKHRNSSFTIRGVGSMANLELVDEESLAIISFLTFSVIEESIYLPLKDTIDKMIPSYNSGRDEALRKKVKQLKNRSQLEWNVQEQYLSPMEWNSAIFELTGLDRASTPSALITTLVRCCKAIYAEFKHSVLPNLPQSGDTGDGAYLGADDLVPIFVYVFCKADLKRPHKYKDLMWNLCHPDQLHGECGYYLTVFESAIEYVEIEPLDEGFEKNSEISSASASASASAGNFRDGRKESTVTVNTATSADSTVATGRSRSGSVFSSLFDSGTSGAKEGQKKRKESIYDQTMNMTGLFAKKTNEASFTEEGEEDDDL